MNRVKETFCILLLIPQLVFVAAGQVETPRSAGKEIESAGARERELLVRAKIVRLLEEVLAAQKTFPDQRLRVMIQAHVADVFWTIDEARARRVFEGALEEAGRWAENANADPKTTVGSYTYPRASVIQLITQRDSNWAAKLVESIGDLADTDPKSGARDLYRERFRMQLQLGIYFARQDPKRAVELMKPLAESRDFNNLSLVLGLVRSMDSAAADEILIQAIAKARLRQPRFSEIYALAVNVFPGFGEGVLRFSPEGVKRDPFTATSTNPKVADHFLQFAYDAGTQLLDGYLTGANGAGLDARSLFDFTAPRLLSGYFDRFMPDKAPAFRARLSQAFGRVPAEQRPYLILTEPGTVQELISRADTAVDTRLKDDLYRRAITQASNDGDLEKATAIISKLSSEAGRANAMSTLSRQMDERESREALNALDKGEVDKAEALAAEVSGWYSQPLLVPNLIGRLSKTDKSRALRVLGEYERRATEIEDGIERSMASMWLAGTAEDLEPGRGFQEMTVAIGEFNRAGFVPELERYRENDLNLSLNIGVGDLLGNWRLSWLGRRDFEQAVLLTHRFQMREAAAAMQLAICRGALGTLPAPRKAPQDSLRR